MQGRIHSYQTMGTLDGPGIRFVLFMQGCPLRCAYCHNPDTWEVEGGSSTHPAEVFRRVLRYKSYFGEQGGVTVSGGEPLLQLDFVTELFQLCREAKIHTCLDTSGCVLPPGLSSLLDVTDLVLLDIKMTTEELYRRYVGCSINQPLELLEELDRRKLPVWIRQVIVGGINEDAANLRRLSGISKNCCVERVELLPFRKLCMEKYKEMGIPFPLEKYPETVEKTIERLSRELALLDGS